MTSKTREQLDRLLEESLPASLNLKAQHLLDDVIDEAFDRGLQAEAQCQ